MYRKCEIGIPRYAGCAAGTFCSTSCRASFLSAFGTPRDLSGGSRAAEADRANCMRTVLCDDQIFVASTEQGQATHSMMTSAAIASTIGMALCAIRWVMVSKVSGADAPRHDTWVMSPSRRQDALCSVVRRCRLFSRDSRGRLEGNSVLAHQFKVASEGLRERAHLK